ncbi:hypothetical protein HYV88_01340 [Candidatus Woesearchaeota archaeon]|nr:hypothetical protein [Candidatus Woesearchaeota archaeon]
MANEDTGKIDKILNEIVEEIAGNDIVPLVELIKNKSNVSEFKIAEKLNITVNHVRNMLYRLNNYNLVYFTRKKDKKKGWYVYYWTLNMLELRNLSIKLKTDMLNKIKNKLANEESGVYFICPDKHVRANHETAMEYSFRCPECDQHLVNENNVKTRQNMEKLINRLNEEIHLLQAMEIKLVKERKLTRIVKKKKVKKINKLKKKIKMKKKKRK